MNYDVTMANISELSTKIREELKNKEFEIKQTQMLNALAKGFGYNNINTMKGLISPGIRRKKKISNDDADQYVAGIIHEINSQLGQTLQGLSGKIDLSYFCYTVTCVMEAFLNELNYLGQMFRMEGYFPYYRKYSSPFIIDGEVTMLGTNISHFVLSPFPTEEIFEGEDGAFNTIYEYQQYRDLSCTPFNGHEFLS